MKTWRQAFVHLALSGVVIAGFSADPRLAGAQQSSPSGQAASSALVAPSSPAQEQQAMLEALPDSPGASLLRLQEQSRTEPGNLDQTGFQAVDSEQQTSAQASTQPQTATPPVSTQPAATQPQGQTPPAQKPVGTAAAGTLAVSGVAASQPAGVAIAPAKQRRVRTMVLRVGAIVGAGVAVGTVVALTAATPSKPPGAH